MKVFFSFRKRLALFTPTLIDVRPIFKNGVIRAGVKGVGVKKRSGGKRADKVFVFQRLFLRKILRLDVFKELLKISVSYSYFLILRLSALK